jgi:hypothetical protein
VLGGQCHYEAVRRCNVFSPGGAVGTRRSVHLDFLIAFPCLGTSSYNSGLVVRVGHHGILIELVLAVRSSVGTLDAAFFVVFGGRSRTFSLGRCRGRSGYVGHGSCSRDLEVCVGAQKVLSRVLSSEDRLGERETRKGEFGRCDSSDSEHPKGPEQVICIRCNREATLLFVSIGR